MSVHVILRKRCNYPKHFSSCKAKKIFLLPELGINGLWFDYRPLTFPAIPSLSHLFTAYLNGSWRCCKKVWKENLLYVRKLSRFSDSLCTKCLQIVQVSTLLQKSVIWANKFQIKVESPHCHSRVISTKEYKWKVGKCIILCINY